MEYKDQIQRITDPERVDELQHRINTTPTRGLIYRKYVQNNPGGLGGGTPSIPYWYPAFAKAKSKIQRKAQEYSRTDKMYQLALEQLPPNPSRGLEIMSDIGRSTGFFASVTDTVDIIDDAVEWVDIYDGQARNIAGQLGKDKDTVNLEWHYGYEFLSRRYDWIKIEFDRVDTTIERALKHLKPHGVIVCYGSYEQCREWAGRTWAQSLEQYQYEHVLGNGKNSFICFSINTNGEKHD